MGQENWENELFEIPFNQLLVVNGSTENTMVQENCEIPLIQHLVVNDSTLSLTLTENSMRQVNCEPNPIATLSGSPIQTQTHTILPSATIKEQPASNSHRFRYPKL